MNNMNLRKLIALIVSAILLLGLLAGCNNTDVSTDTTGSTTGTEDSTTATTPSVNASGLLVFNANGGINIFYDEEGMVLELTGLDDDGSALIESYENFLGESCSTIICKLIEDSFNTGSLDKTGFVMLKVAVGSSLPGTNFLEGLKVDAQAQLDTLSSAAKLIVLSADELDANGYIDAVSAQEMALAYLDIASFDSFDGANTPTDGTYYFTITVNGQSEYVSVDAVTGLVSNAFLDMQEEDTEVEDDQPAADATAPVTEEENAPEEGE